MPFETYTFTELQTAVTHALHGTPNSSAPASQIVNRSLNYLAKMRPWRWRMKNLSLNITATALTSLTRASNVVTAVQTAHGFSVGSSFSVIGADNSFKGQFIVAGVTSSSIFTYSQNGSDETASTAGSTIPGALVLPADFDTLITLKGAITSYQTVYPTSMEDMWMMRQNAYGYGYETWYALNWQSQASVTAAPRAVLEVYPIPQAAAIGGFVGTYNRLIPTMSAGTDVPDVPQQYHGLLMVLCRAMAVSNEEDRSGSDWELFSNMLKDLAADEGQSQGVVVGQMRSTLKMPFRVSNFYPNGRIQA